MRDKLSGEAHAAAIDLADRAKALFLEDQANDNGKTFQGIKLIFEIEDIIQAARKRRAQTVLPTTQVASPATNGNARSVATPLSVALDRVPLHGVPLDRQRPEDLVAQYHLQIVRSGIVRRRALVQQRAQQIGARLRSQPRGTTAFERAGQTDGKEAHVDRLRPSRSRKRELAGLTLR